MSSKAQHVVPQGGKWRVRRAGATRASGIYETQEEAVRIARDLARKNKTDLYIHGWDGLIREREVYGADSIPSKG